MLFTYSVFALSLDTPVDWWNNPPKRVKHKKELSKKTKLQVNQQSTISIEIQHALTKLKNPNAYDEPHYHEYIKIIADNIKQIPTSELEKLPTSVMLEISKYQYENYIKGTKPLVAFFIP